LIKKKDVEIISLNSKENKKKERDKMKKENEKKWSKMSWNKRKDQKKCLEKNKNKLRNKDI
jgi:hypothetical protein